MKDLSQREGRYALERVRYVVDSNDRLEPDKRWMDRYSTLVKKASTMVLMNGLGQTLAFLLADAQSPPDKVKRDSGPGTLYLDISDWLIKELRVYQDGKDIFTRVLEGTRDEYMTAQEYTFRLLGWLKRLCDAMIPEGGD